MKKTTYAFLAILILTITCYADQYIPGYRDKNGRYVPGHYRGEADGNPYNNRNCPRNKNPYKSSYY